MECLNHFNPLWLNQAFFGRIIFSLPFLGSLYTKCGLNGIFYPTTDNSYGNIAIVLISTFAYK